MALVVVLAQAEQPVGTSKYASVSDVQFASPGLSATDDEIQNALIFAEAIIDAFAKKSFAPAISQTVFDVRTDSVVFDVSGVVTSVAVNNFTMPEDSYELPPWGLRFREPVNGMWFNPARPYTIEPIRQWWGTNRGVTVKAIGTFGEVSALIKEATVLLALDRLARTGPQESTGTTVIPALPSNVTSFSVEGLSVGFSSNSTGTSTSRSTSSTGNLEVDRLINLVLGNGAYVV